MEGKLAEYLRILMVGNGIQKTWSKSSAAGGCFSVSSPMHLPYEPVYCTPPNIHPAYHLDMWCRQAPTKSQDKLDFRSQRGKARLFSHPSLGTPDLELESR